MKVDSSSKEEAAALLVKELRERISDIIQNDCKFDDDFYLHRWLLSQQSKVDRTEAVIREAVVWRKENNVEILANTDWDVAGIIKDIPVYMDTFDKNGQPVVKVNGDKLDIPGIIKKHGKEAAIKFIIELYAKFEKLLVEHNNWSKNKNMSNFNQDQSQNATEEIKLVKYNSNSTSALVVIGSFKDFSLWNVKSLEVMQIFVEGTKIGTRYFPCLATDIYMINTNRFSTMFFKMIKPLLAAIPSNVECFDCDQSKWSKKLQGVFKYYPNNHQFHTLGSGSIKRRVA